MIRNANHVAANERAVDLAVLPDDVVLANAGHFPLEIDVDGFLASPDVTDQDEYEEGIRTLRLADLRRIHLLGEGHMVNLAGPRPLGNSIESMDLGFSLQVRCLEAVAGGSVGTESCVVPVPRAIDEIVARRYVELAGPRATR
jgi:adenosylhomocysteinase